MDDLGHGVHDDVHVDQLREEEVNLGRAVITVTHNNPFWLYFTSSFEKVNSLLPIYSNTPGSLEEERCIINIPYSKILAMAAEAWPYL